MKTFANSNARDAQHAVTLASDARKAGRVVAFSSGGSDLLALVKDHIVEPDVVVSLRGMKGADQVASGPAGVVIGAEVTLDALSRHDVIGAQFPVLAEAAGSVATPQIRNVGTIGGNVAQRPWCWYYRNGFPCYKAGGNQCFSFAGENQFHAIFGGGPSYIVHPSDTAPALLALDATFRVAGRSGERTIAAKDFFVLPRQDAAHENVLGPDDVIVSVQLPTTLAGARGRYHKVLDREAWTHAVVSAAVVLKMDGDTCRTARVVLGGVAPIPWRLPEVEKMLTGQRITDDLAARAGQASTTGARALSKNAYKLPLTRGVVRRAILEAAGKTAV